MKIKVAKGNKKIGDDTLILNITSATDCPSKKLGLCKHPKICYAYHSEIFRTAEPHNCLKSRRQAARIWRTLSSSEIAKQLKSKVKRAKKNKIKYLRFSESGDFRNQEDVLKLFRIARSLKGLLKVYGYTARRDLDFTYAPSNLTVNGSNFMVHNNFIAKTRIDFEKTRGLKCKMNCRICNLCKVRRGKEIFVKFHGAGLK